MDHQKLETTSSMASTTPMLPKEDEKIVFIPPQNGGIGKILIREDTILANLPGCAGCGRPQFACGGVKKQWSALCWGRPSDSKYYCLLTLLAATFVLSLLGTVFFCFTNTVNDAILSSMVIRKDSLAFSVWRRPNVQPMMRVHIFNYTNWQRVRDGLDEKLNVEEVGPYVYSQQIERVNIEFINDTVTFQERNIFTYMPELSTGASYDMVNVPNLPLLGLIAKAGTVGNDAANFLLEQALSARSIFFSVNHPNAFLTLSVHSFLWGYDDDLITAAKPLLSLRGELNFSKFGLLVTKNGTMSDRVTINTGEYDKDKMNIIERLNGRDRLSTWSGNECNSIEASDGSIFPPSLLDKKKVLQVLYPQLCRRLPYEYERDIEIVDGIQLLRYRLPHNVFDHPDTNPINECYCDIDTGVCPPKGVVNITTCAMGAPAFVSLPHFYLAEDRLRQDITGLHPDPSRQMNYLDIHPTLGIALSGKSSLQMNIQVKKHSTYSSTRFLKPDIILPIAWMEMGVDELPESLRSLVYHGTFSTAAVQLGLMVTSIVALLVSGTCLCLLLIRRKRKPCVTLKKYPGDTELKPAS